MEKKASAGKRPKGGILKISPRSVLEIFNAMDDPVFVKDEKHRWVIVNDRMCEVIGVTRENLLGKNDYDFSPKREADVFWEKDDLVLRTGEPNINEEHVTWQGQEYVISTMKSLLVDPETNRRYIVGTIRDITTRKKLEQEREELLVEIKDRAD